MKEAKYLLGDHIRKLRTQRGLPQEALGEKAGLHHTYIGAVERGEQNCTVSVLEKIAHGLDIRIDELFSFAAEPDINELRTSVLQELRESPPEVIQLVSDVLKRVKPLVKKSKKKSGKQG